MRPLNLAPLVSAGPDRGGLAPGATVTLQGTVSDDGLPDGTLAVAWLQVSGPAAAVLGSPEAVVTLGDLPRRRHLRPPPDRERRRAGRERDADGRGLAGEPGAARQRGPRPQRSRIRGGAGAPGRGVGRRPARGSPHVQWTAVSGPGAVVFADPAARRRRPRASARPGATCCGSRRATATCRRPTRPPSSSGRPARVPT